MKKTTRRGEVWGGGGVCCHRWVLQPRRRQAGGLRGGSYDLRIAKIAKVWSMTKMVLLMNKILAVISKKREFNIPWYT